MKIINSLLVIILSVSEIVANNSYLENFNPDSLRYKISYATRCIDPPSIDGRLDDESWNMAIPLSEFFQLESTFGATSGVPARRETADGLKRSPCQRHSSGDSYLEAGQPN